MNVIGWYKQAGQRLKEERENAGMQAEDVAAALRIPTQTYLNYEQGTACVPACQLTFLATLYRLNLPHFLAEIEQTCL